MSLILQALKSSNYANWMTKLRQNSVSPVYYIIQTLFFICSNYPRAGIWIEIQHHHIA